MATTTDLLLDFFGRPREAAHQLSTPPAPGANTIAWLLWHLTRAMDEQVAQVLGYDAVWEAGGWRERFDLPLPPDTHGFGMTFEEVLLVRASAEE